ncbi:DUF4272 domain-containing protein [Pigmentiphaga aceris]|uniref:DUF4272 domain-containing protein n=1 Tax=Pigmentiphaga aceris TaxID=1940612 RepID=A0A5C0B1H4_9BURK|nr:DUF4272 domain-containing protein [Pigmentiphaga aceris]QEI06487.1 DUF4272 domain-containing protein [Pigmentiphaga aceris]
MKDLLSRLKSMFGGGSEPVESTVAAPATVGTPEPGANTVLINAYCTVGILPPADFVHTPIARRDLSDPALADHLKGFVGYIAGRGDGQMTSTRYHLIRHVQRVRQHLSLEIPTTGMDAFADWALRANALVFLPDSSIRDPFGRMLMDAEGNPPDPEAIVPYPQDAWERKARTEAQLASRGWRLPAHLPPLPGEAEVRLRRADEVLGRVSALCAVAFRAKTVHSDDPIPVGELFERLPHGSDCLTPNEAAFMANPMPDQSTAAELSWRFECVPVLEWALGLREDLPFPDGSTEPQLALLELSSDQMAELPPKVRLRPTAEILDALDLHYRAHWLVRQARVDDRPPPEGLVPGIVAERHYALNWLVHFEDAEWDEVDTPT